MDNNIEEMEVISDATVDNSTTDTAETQPAVTEDVTTADAADIQSTDSEDTASSDKDQRAEIAAKLNTFGKEHKSIWQFIKFSFVSMFAGICEMATYWIFYLAFGKMTQGIDSLAFLYLGNAPAFNMFLATVISAVVGQVIGFILNFKKTFHSTNNIWISAIGYAIMAILIVFGLNTYVGNLLANALETAMPNMIALADFLAKFIAMFSTVVIVFPMNKFVLMKDTKKERN